MPPRTAAPHTADPRRRAPLVIAHRAGNHLELLPRVQRLGVGLVEADVHLHRGRLEVRHLKTLGPVPVLWDTWRLANPFAPRLELEQLLAEVDGEMPIMLDLKGRSRELPARVQQALGTRPQHAATAVCARSWKLLEPFAADPHVDAVWSVGRRRQLRRLHRQHGGSGQRLDGVSIHERLLDERTVAELAALARTIMCWPVNTIERARVLLDWGVHGLITDRPELLVPALAGPRPGGPSAHLRGAPAA